MTIDVNHPPRWYTLLIWALFYSAVVLMIAGAAFS